MGGGEQLTSIDTLLEQLGKACNDLKAHPQYAANNQVSWVEILEHFRNVETMLKRKNEEFVLKESKFEVKEFETNLMLKKREAAISASEKDLVNRFQGLKDAAVAEIVEARNKYHPTSLDSVYEHAIETEVISSLGVRNAPVSGVKEESPYITGGRAPGVAVEIKPRPELVQFCQQMDANGLLNFIMENQNILSIIRDELSVALNSASDPSRLVLDSLEGYFPHAESAHSVDPNYAAFEGMRKSCITIMEAMATLLAKAGPQAFHLLRPEIKQRARATANGWKLKWANRNSDPANINPLEAVAFLQLLVSFGIVSDFDKEEFSKYILAAACNEQTPGLCRSLGLAHNVEGYIQVLIDSGKQVEAVHLIHAFHFTKRFPVVSLLKTYLREMRRTCQGRSGAGEALQNEVNARELGAVNAVISCIKKYKLQAEYPLQPLEKRWSQLERARVDREKCGDPSRRPSTKRQRLREGEFGGNRGWGGFADASSRKHVPVYGETAAPVASAAYTGYTEMYPHVASSASVAPAAYTGYAEMYPSQVATATYTGQSETYPPHAVQNWQAYQVPGQSTYPQATIPQHAYYYPQDDGAAPYNPVVPSAIPPTNGSYVASGLQPATQPYM